MYYTTFLALKSEVLSFLMDQSQKLCVILNKVLIFVKKNRDWNYHYTF